MELSVQAPIIPASDSDLPEPTPRAGRSEVGSLAQKATRGVAWLLLQTLASRGVQFVSEVILAWWLSKEDFALRIEALTVYSFAVLLQDNGVNQALVQRHRVDRWANPAFWLSLAIGLMAGIVLAATAPLVARAYDAKPLIGMILILAARSPIAALATVSYAKLQTELRFKTLAIVNFLVVCVTAISAVVLAKLGFGAYSFIWPLFFAAVARSVMLWVASPPRIRGQLQIHRWKYLTNQSGMLLLASVLFTLTSQGDYATLGLVYKTPQGPAPLVGVYAFGFMICVQTTQFITSSLANVLLPTLSRLQHDPDRLKSAFLRATRMLAVVGVYACLIQAAVAAPMVQAILRVKHDPGKWVPAVPIIQVISLAMALQLFNMPAQSLIQAQGRFRTLLRLAIGCPVFFFACIWTAAAMGRRPDGEIRWTGLSHLLDHLFRQHVNVSSLVAIAVAVYCLITGPFCLWIAIRPLRGSWREIWPIYLWPVVTSSVAILAGMVAGQLLPHTPLGNFGKLLLVPAVSLVVYVPLVRWTAPQVWTDLKGRFSGLLKRRRK